MKILDLSVTYHWYDMIASGVKDEEYREFKLFYNVRFKKNKIPTICSNITCDYCVYSNCTTIKYDAVRFHRGQGSKITMLVKWKGLEYGFGNPRLGAPRDRKVWIIKLGKVLERGKDYAIW